ncbi:hypothetical protein ACLM44_00450 [Synechococcus sp. W2B2]|uniref:hypothetical protein n=1 Tax=unclassified Synechococcus TaxID=2626047 RepID=UPI00006ADB24|nr:hypothetical protein [Synechococcus sp. WH 7805]EAR17530.1 hypothetical protein WH7805_00410 [Synechococcus sp. WH 7805]
MRQLIAPLVLLLIAIGFWLSDRPTADTAGGGESSADITTDDADVAKKKVDTKDSADTGVAKKKADTKDSADARVAKKKADTKDSVDTIVSDDIFPQKYLTNWETDEGLLSLMRAPDSKTIRGIYFHPVRTNEIRGKIVTSYISRRSAATLTGFWFQPVSDKKCNFEKNGTYYWGRLAFMFKDNSFKGIWGYCGDEANYYWNGKRA